MPGTMVGSTSGASGVDAWASESGSSFRVAVVNGNSAPVSCPVAPDHWPVESTGNGTVHV
jgi:hypothetical protein